MLNEKELLKIANKLGKSKKAKNNFKEQIKIFDSLKGVLGGNVERQKIPMEFENIKDFEKYVKEYIKKYSNEIAEFSNRILLLNQKIIVSESEDDIFELYAILNGFSSFLMINSLNLTEK